MNSKVQLKLKLNEERYSPMKMNKTVNRTKEVKPARRRSVQPVGRNSRKFKINNGHFQQRNNERGAN